MEERSKKMLRRLVLFTLFIVFVFCPKTVSALAAELSEEEIYSRMSEHFLKREEEFRIETEYNDTVKSILKRINSIKADKFYSVFFDMAQVSDDPDTTDDADYLYGLIDDVYCEYVSGELCFYDVRYYEGLKQTKKVNISIKKLAKEIKAKKKSVYGRIKLSHDYIIDTIKYDHRKNCSYSAYGGLYKGRTVCNGYALILYKLLNEMDIPCKFVTGYVNGNPDSLHAWNIVKIKNKWYHIDCTWDDDDDGIYYRDYFLKSEKSMKADHTMDYFYMTEEFMEAYPIAVKDFKRRK